MQQCPILVNEIFRVCAISLHNYIKGFAQIKNVMVRLAK
jgi:hypothetical protein